MLKDERCLTSIVGAARRWIVRNSQGVRIAEKKQQLDMRRWHGIMEARLGMSWTGQMLLYWCVDEVEYDACEREESLRR